MVTTGPMSTHAPMSTSTASPASRPATLTVVGTPAQCSVEIRNVMGVRLLKEVSCQRTVKLAARAKSQDTESSCCRSRDAGVGTAGSRSTGAGPNVDPQESAGGPLRNRLRPGSRIVRGFSAWNSVRAATIDRWQRVCWGALPGCLADWSMRERSARRLTGPFREGSTNMSARFQSFQFTTVSSAGR